MHIYLELIEGYSYQQEHVYQKFASNVYICNYKEVLNIVLWKLLHCDLIHYILLLGVQFDFCY